MSIMDFCRGTWKGRYMWSFPPGFHHTNGNPQVCKLKKSLNGLSKHLANGSQNFLIPFWILVLDSLSLITLFLQDWRANYLSFQFYLVNSSWQWSCRILLESLTTNLDFKEELWSTFWVLKAVTSTAFLYVNVNVPGRFSKMHRPTKFPMEQKT